MIPIFPIYIPCPTCKGKGTITEPDLPYEDLITRDCPECKKGFRKKTKPTVVCLCGSTRFSEAFQTANLEETLAGKIVLSIGCNLKSDADLFADVSADGMAQVKAFLDELHLHKIDLADEVLILNVGGYIGESTVREIAYAEYTKKSIRYLEVRS